jgi:hypothetical protein
MTSLIRSLSGIKYLNYKTSWQSSSDDMVMSKNGQVNLRRSLSPLPNALGRGLGVGILDSKKTKQMFKYLFNISSLICGILF